MMLTISPSSLPIDQGKCGTNNISPKCHHDTSTCLTGNSPFVACVESLTYPIMSAVSLKVIVVAAAVGDTVVAYPVLPRERLAC